MSSIYLIDYYSNSIESVLHKASPVSKIVFLFLILISIISSKSIFSLLVIFSVISFLIILAKLPFFRILTWSFYPAFFTSLFAVSQFEYGLLPLQTMFRAVSAALSMIFLACTTSYPALFSLFGRISSFLANIFFLTYRYFFLLIDSIQVKLRLMRIRGGYRGGLVRTLKNIGRLLGLIFVFSIEKSERFYNILAVRGYKGIISSKRKYSFHFFDLILVIIGLSVLIFQILWIK